MQWNQTSENFSPANSSKRTRLKNVRETRRMENTTGIRSSIVRRNRRNFKAGRSYQHDRSLVAYWPGPRPPTPGGGVLFGGRVCRIIRLCLGVDDRKASLRPWLLNKSRNLFIGLRFIEWSRAVSRILKSSKHSKKGLCPLLEESSICDTGLINIGQASQLKIEKYLRESLSKIDSRHLVADGLAQNILHTLLTSYYMSKEDEQTTPTHVDERAFGLQTQACDRAYVQLEATL